jgi:hypothetical protein
MGHVTSVINAFTAVFLLPGDIVCDAIGVGKADNRDLARMLINSFVWAFLGAIVVFFLV